MGADHEVKLNTVLLHWMLFGVRGGFFIAPRSCDRDTTGSGTTRRHLRRKHRLMQRRSMD